MNAKSESKGPKPAEFLTEAKKLADKFGWRSSSFDRDEEVILTAVISDDASFDRCIWIYDTERTTLRCMLVSKVAVPAGKRPQVLELLARINQDLPFGCAEFSFDHNVVVYRDSADLDWGPIERLVGGTTTRALTTGQRYAKALEQTLAGTAPEIAIRNAEGA
jgi:hypothetical protein